MATENTTLSLNALLRLLGPETTRLIGTYKGEPPLMVIRRAMRLLAQADGHVDHRGKVRVRPREEKRN